MMRGTGRLRRLLGRPSEHAPLRIDSPEAEAAAFAAAGDVLSRPSGDLRGLLPLNGTRRRLFDPLAAGIRAEYATVLVHFWAIHQGRIDEYRRAAGLFDAVVSPSEEYDSRLAFAPIYRSNGMDLLVDDTL